MKAAVVSAAGGVPAYADFPEPEVDERRGVVELVAAAIHPVVRSRVAGQHYSVAGRWPAVPGVDAVARTPDGTLVYTGFVQPPWGTMAERMAVPGGFGTPLPDGADPLAVAAGMNPGMASYIALARRRDAAAAASDGSDRGLGTVVVLGATGVAGGLAVANALELGATRVVAAGRNADRLARVASTDAERVTTVQLASEGAAITEALVAALAGTMPSIVIDFCWGPVAEAAFAALGSIDEESDADPAGTSYMEIGAAAGADATVPAALLRSRPVTLGGGGLGGTAVSEIMVRLPEYIGLIASGRVEVPYESYALADVATAWTADTTARVVLVP
jgi:NADPH:quinone reductase-like Zn-dependent oxidoreductase